MQKILLGVVGILITVLVLFVLDSLSEPSTPEFHDAPTLFCTTRYTGITLPPFGIYICPEYDSQRLRAHELVHWNQYENYGLLGFYGNYIKGMVATGFSYEDHPMEYEARKRTQEFMDKVSY